MGPRRASTVRLEGVPVMKSSYEDEGTPYEGEVCGCSKDGPDGHDDLLLKFSTPAIIEALGDVGHGGEMASGRRPSRGTGTRSASACPRARAGSIRGAEGVIPSSPPSRPSPPRPDVSLSRAGRRSGRF
jgi:hypothetical protein